MRLRLFTGWLSLALLALAISCSRERSRAVEAVAAEGAEERDYRGMLERARERQAPDALIATVEKSIQRFQFELARLPTNLMELVVLGYLPEIHPAPDGFAYSYDPVHGNVRLTPVQGAGTGVELPADMTNENRAKLIEVNLPPPK